MVKMINIRMINVNECIIRMINVNECINGMINVNESIIRMMYQVNDIREQDVLEAKMSRARMSETDYGGQDISNDEKCEEQNYDSRRASSTNGRRERQERGDGAQRRVANEIGLEHARRERRRAGRRRA